MSIPTYLRTLTQHHQTSIATEQTHRPALQVLLQTCLPTTLITNEPKQIDCGAPDFVITRNDIPLGYVEAKNIGISLDDKIHQEQLNRYTKSLDNLIFTNYLEFRLYRHATLITTVTIATLRDNQIKPLKQNYPALKTLIDTFDTHHSQPITTAEDLAARMAAKTRTLAATISEALTQNQSDTNDLQNNLTAFRRHLIHDIQPATFADIYAQTIAYGMFAARLHDPTLNTFTRQQAATLIPAYNPFLRKFFQYIAGFDLDPRIHWIVNDLADLFRATNTAELMKRHGKTTQRTDPYLHFYETFLGKYNPKLRQSRGVYYTPEPVVNFIVRAVDDILQTDFNLPNGIADTSKTQRDHKVQILDPATGTGTFLAAIIQHTHDRYFITQKGRWSDYAKTDLIPRLNGFELLMAPYVMAHTKLDMVLRDTGCTLTTDRLNIFLTNTLEEHKPAQSSLLDQWLSNEGKQAGTIKRDTPVMVVIGNPPYAVSSSNKGTWITSLIEDYKKNLKEQKIHIQDDYIKFIRYGEHLVQRTGEGILAYITNNSFLDGPTHRQMRKHLMETFDKIYILNLHGDALRDDTTDKNVFDIKQGVSINLFVKTGGENKKLASVFYSAIHGSRESKYQYLWGNNMRQVFNKKLNNTDPYYFFAPKDFSHQDEYEKGFKITNLFRTYNAGAVTGRDALFINFDSNILATRMKKLLSGDYDEDFKTKYRVTDSSGYKITRAIQGKTFNATKIRPLQYRPFDYRHIYYDPAVISRAGQRVMKHLLAGENCALITSRQFGSRKHFICFITNSLNDFSSQPFAPYYIFPLYLYPDPTQKTTTTTRTPNLNPDIIKTITKTLTFTPTPIDLLDYIYAVLHAPTYRQRYREFLKIDFPRIPYPTTPAQFRHLITIGRQLRTLHLLHTPTITTDYPVPGDNIVTTITYRPDPKTHLGRLYINQTQHFDRVPEAAWNLYIGGYQPAQKWLKDRKGRQLTHQDLAHYQHIITALTQTTQLMEKADKALTT